MTGFGFGDSAFAGGRISVEIRSGNQRFLDVRARLPAELSHFTMFTEQIVRERIRRGRVDLVVRSEGVSGAAAVLDRDRAKSALAALVELRDEMAPGADLPLSLLVAVPGLFAIAEPDPDALRAAIRAAIERSVTSMDAMLHKEGAALAADLGGRAARVTELLHEVKERAELLPMLAKKRLEERLSRLTGGAEAPLDAGRLEAEVLVLADKSDVTEEVTRLASHIDQFEAALWEKDEPVGRKLDFLLQEMLREAHTVAAKAQDSKVSEKIVAFKVELERLREQVQNVE